MSCYDRSGSGSVDLTREGTSSHVTHTICIANIGVKAHGIQKLMAALTHPECSKQITSLNLRGPLASVTPSYSKAQVYISLAVFLYGIATSMEGEGMGYLCEAMLHPQFPPHITHLDLSGSLSMHNCTASLVCVHL